MKSKIKVIAEFKIGLNERDLELLIQIQKYFGGVGTLHYNASVNS